MPHRVPGSKTGSNSRHLSGKPIQYYRPRGSAEVQHLVDEGFQAFNAGRLSEACHVFSDKMLSPSHDTTIGLTIAGAMPTVTYLMTAAMITIIFADNHNLDHQHFTSTLKNAD